MAARGEVIDQLAARERAASFLEKMRSSKGLPILASTLDRLADQQGSITAELLQDLARDVRRLMLRAAAAEATFRELIDQAYDEEFDDEEWEADL